MRTMAIMGNDSVESDNRRGQLLVLVPAAILPFLGSFLYFVILPGAQASQLVYGGVKVFTLLYPLFVLFGIERVRPRLQRISWRRHLRSLPLGLLTGLAMVLAMAGVFALTPVGEMLLGNRAQIQEKVADLGILPWYIPFSCFIVFFHSLLEEYYWRWFVYGRARTVLPRAWAHILAGLAFALHHYVVLSQYMSLGYALFMGTFVGIGGIIWSLQYERQRSLAGAWISHACVDAFIFALGYFILFL